MHSLEIGLRNVAKLGENAPPDANANFGIHSDEQVQIIDLASRIEKDRRRCLEWYMDDPIYPLGSLTAAELVSLGKGHLVVGFLKGIAYLDHAHFAAF